MLGRPRETSPARTALFALGALALAFLSWVVAGALAGEGPGEAGRRVAPDPAAVAQEAPQVAQAPEDDTGTPAPEVDNSNVDSYAAYESKDPFRQLLRPKSSGATTGSGASTTSGPGDAGAGSGTGGSGAGATGTSGPAAGATDGSGGGAGAGSTTGASGGGGGAGSGGPLAGETVTVTRRDQQGRPLAAVVRDADEDYAASDGAAIIAEDASGRRTTFTDGGEVEITARPGAVVLRKSPDAGVTIRAFDRVAGPLKVVRTTGITREGVGDDAAGSGGATLPNTGGAFFGTPR